MLRHPASIVLLFLISISSYSQHREPTDYKSIYQHAEKLYNSPNATDQTDSLALISFLKVISILENKPVGDSILFDSYLKSGILEMSKKDEERAVTHLLLALEVKKRSAHLHDSLLFQPYLFAGSVYYDLNNLDSALYCYRKAEDLVNKFPSLSGSERLYNKSGALYYETGDYKKSIQYFNKALSLVESKQPANVYFIVNYKNNIASALRKLRKYDEAMEIYKSLLSYHINKNELLHNIGVTYLNAGKYAEAIDHLKQVQYNNRVKDNDIGYAYLQLKQYDSANIYLQAAYAAYKKNHPGQKDLDYGITLKYLGDLMMAKSKITDALINYQLAVIQTDLDFNDNDIKSNPVSFHGLHNSFFLFNVLVAKAEAFRALSVSQPKSNALTNAFSAYATAIMLARHVEQTYNSDEAKLFLVDNANKAYQNIIDLGLQLYEATKNNGYLRKAFGYMEDSKASVLRADLLQLSFSSISNLPQVLINEEKNLRATIAKLNIAISASGDSSVVADIQKKIIDNEIRLSDIQAKLDADPKYYQLKFSNGDISVDSIREKILSRNTAIISFYYLKNKLICFYITKEEYGYRSIPLDDSLQKNILLLRKELGNGETHHRKTIEKLTSYLFNELVKPVYDKIENKTHLVVIPHNEISYIPFEVLTGPKENELLLKKFSISYNYSASFLVSENQKTFSKQAYSALAMAPFASSTFSDALPVLKKSFTEIENIKGKIFVDSEATKQHFIRFSSSYPVIHLATHAVANDIDPLQSFIEFYARGNEADTLHRLYEQEIYNLDMQPARLVILSACETGNGQLINSEGIMSLSRAFSYAGCKSVITSLWKADDEATAFIGKRIHYYLQKGFQKDEALQKAKIDYLNDPSIEPAHKTPAYWAHLVLIGDVASVEQKNNWIYWIIRISLLCLVIILFIKYKRQLTGNKNKTRHKQ